MNSWWTLLNKEYRMIRTSVLVQLAVLVIGGFWLLYQSHRHEEVVVIMGPAAMIIALAMFYPALFMLKNLSRELKHTPHLLLHCPQPAWMLLSAKLVAGLVYMIVVMLVAAVFVYWGLFSSYSSEQTGMATSTMALFVTEASTYAGLTIIATSIYLASWGTLMAVVIATARNLLGRFRWLAGLGVFFAATWGMGHLVETWLFQKITQWGTFNISLLSLREMMPAHDHFFGGQIYAGEILFYFIITAALFALSAWLIDNKVEV